MREGFRYRAKAGKLKPSGSSGGYAIVQPKFDDNMAFDFARDLSFLEDNSQKRATYNSMSQGDSNSESCSQKYVYQNKKAKGPSNNNAKEEVIAQIMNNQNELLKNMEVKNQGMKYDGFWRYLDSCMENLPQVVAMDLHRRFLEMVTEKVEINNIENV